MANGMEKRPPRQIEDGPPVVDNPRGRYMGEGRMRPRRIEGEVRMMDAAPPPQGGGELMDPVPAGRSRPRRRETLPDQQGARLTGSAEKYVRLQLRVADGMMSVVSARAVEGPLVLPTEVHGPFAYEVRVDGRRIGLGSVADVGVARSFPNLAPDAPPEQRGHYIEEEPSFEFTVRVPQADLPSRSLPRTQVTLYRVKETPAQRTVGAASLAQQFSRELREVARLDGVRLEALEPPLAEELRRALR